MTVYVVHRPQQRGPDNSYDVSSAVEYGPLEYIYEDGFIPYRDPERAETIAWDKLKDFTSDDYLLWAGGDPAGMVIVSMILGFRTDGEINLLRWDRDKDTRQMLGGRYVPIKLTA